MATKILIIDDEPAQRRILEEMLKRFGYEPFLVSNAHAGLECLHSAPKAFGAIILDLVMPEMDGIEFLEHLDGETRSLPVIVQTAQGSIDTVIKAMRAGADDFVVKPINPERLRVSLQNLLKVQALTGEVKRLNQKHQGFLSFADLIANSPAMSGVSRLVERGAHSQIPILIEGESGVGKEMIARAIHGEGDRSGKPFVPVNCGAIPEGLVESILFGHEKGAFTGAATKHIGKFQEADGGTLFLDEVGELPLDIQVKLLRALQEGEVDPVGARRSVKINIRLISATNRNMIDMVKENKFREDLFYRLNVFPILVPPLRQRQEDIPALVDHFITRFSAEEGRKIKGITPEALSLLMQYSWPGNVRQLENTVFRAVVLNEGDLLDLQDFPQVANLVDGFEIKIPPAPTLPSNPATSLGAKAILGNDLPLPTPDHPGILVQEDGCIGIQAVGGNGHVRKLEEVEADMIRVALQRYGGQMSEVARKLGIGRSTLYRKMRDFGLEMKVL